MSASITDRLRAIRKEVGYSTFDHAIRSLNRERLSNRDRQKRKRFSPKVYQQLFDRQNGDCPYCESRLLVPARRNVIDHFDPNAEDFNAQGNIRLVHPGCNAEKGAMTPIELAKKLGRPLTTLTTRKVSDDIEPA
jgi:hypothetical protein